MILALGIAAAAVWLLMGGLLWAMCRAAAIGDRLLERKRRAARRWEWDAEHDLPWHERGAA